MRIISGKLKQKTLLSFNHDTTRPTSDKVKEAMFDSIFDKVKGNFLDLFSGTGSIGFEAYSRGAKKVVLVDSNSKAIKNIIDNVKHLGINDCNFCVVHNDYNVALKKLEKDKIIFDVVYIDPPYASDFAEHSLEYLCKSKLINEDSILIWEHDKNKLNNNIFEKFELIKQKKYGIAYLSYLKLKF